METLIGPSIQTAYAELNIYDRSPPASEEMCIFKLILKQKPWSQTWKYEVICNKMIDSGHEKLERQNKLPVRD